LSRASDHCWQSHRNRLHYSRHWPQILLAPIAPIIRHRANGGTAIRQAYASGNWYGFSRFVAPRLLRHHSRRAWPGPASRWSAPREQRALVAVEVRASDQTVQPRALGLGKKWPRLAGMISDTAGARVVIWFHVMPSASANLRQGTRRPARAEGEGRSHSRPTDGGSGGGVFLKKKKKPAADVPLFRRVFRLRFRR